MELNTYYIEAYLSSYGKKYISISDLALIVGINKANIAQLYEAVEEMVAGGYIRPVKTSGLNGNYRFPLYKRYLITYTKAVDTGALEKIKSLHPKLLQNGYLKKHPEEYSENEETINALNMFFFNNEGDDYISKKERSFALFGNEKTLDEDKKVPSLLSKLKLGKTDLKYYETPEYSFPDYIPVRKDHLTLLVCENKDIWYGIRRCMYERNFSTIFGTSIDGTVYGGGNKISKKEGALIEYVKFMGNPEIKFLYWGDIDREGFDIYRRTRKVNPGLDISLFLPGYKEMIRRARTMKLRQSPSGKKENMTFEDVLVGFNDDEMTYLNDILSDNIIIPQEIIPYTFLREE